MRLELKSKYLRNFTFGVEDSLISTVGVLSGVAISKAESPQIVLTGIVLIAVEAFSMAIGSLLTEHSADQYAAHRETSFLPDIPLGLTMFFSYFLAGFVPLSPYLFLPVNTALIISIIVSLVALFALGLVNAKIARVGLLKSALQMFFLGGLAVVIGSLIGRLF